MDRGEPALVPQWYKFPNGSASNNALQSNSSKHSGRLGSRDKSLGDQDRNLLRSLSSNGSAIYDKGSSGKSQAYSSFRRSRDRNQEKDFDSREREIKSVLVDNGFDHRDSFLGVGAEKDALRRSQSMIAGRQVNSWPKKLGSSGNNIVPSVGTVSGSISKTLFEKDFPSLRAEGKHGFSDTSDVSPLGLRTAVQSLPVVSSVIFGTSALAEVPVKVETNGTIISPALQAAPTCQASAAGITMSGLNMAEALAQAPSQVGNTQLTVDTQRIEELALKKCKQLIPMTPSMPKAWIARGGDFSSLAKVGQQSHVNHTFRPSARSDIAKTAQVGNFHVLNREKNSISHVAKDGPGIGKVMDPTGLTSTAAVLPSKRRTDQNFKVDNKNGAVTHISLGERKLLSQSKNRNDFFNLLRKKSLTSPRAIPEASSTEPTSSLEKEVDNLQITSVNVRKNSLPSVLVCSTENGNVLNGDSCASDESESFDADNGEANPSSDTIVDPEEEAFLQSLGWDKNAWEEALTEEEIDAFLKKYEKRRPLKIVPTDLYANNLSGEDA
ncbi:hypothetical protein C4D60_Mb08t23490 [Musa balbisiana]|uniref:Uncharacterized protein n=1 Tax=Musa balbisiana TaxID=52838 RepID=A0A4S8K5Y7_MUSBA|nr:hypothetical protein C4D60_Mb08t23490 [Musa balbisiana]